MAQGRARQRRQPARPDRGASVIDLDARRQSREQRRENTLTTGQDDSPGWLLRAPAHQVVENLVPWAGIADGGSFAALLGDPTDAHLIRTRFPARALARRFCGGPTLDQVAAAITQEPRRIKARVWVGGYGGPEEGISVAAVYVRFEGLPSDADGRADRHPALWAWVADRLRHSGTDTDTDSSGDTGSGSNAGYGVHPWPEPDEIAADRTDVRGPGTWWRLRWGPSRTPYARSARSGRAGASGPPDEN